MTEKQEGANELLLCDEQGGGRKQKQHMPHYLFTQRLYSMLHSCLTSLVNYKPSSFDGDGHLSVFSHCPGLFIMAIGGCHCCWVQCCGYSLSLWAFVCGGLSTVVGSWWLLWAVLSFVVCSS